MLLVSIPLFPVKNSPLLPSKADNTGEDSTYEIVLVCKSALFSCISEIDSI